jgi:hypothetical protein
MGKGIFSGGSGIFARFVQGKYEFWVRFQQFFDSSGSLF